MKKNILICHVHMETGGIETSLVNLLTSLNKDKYNIDLLLFYPKGDLLKLIPHWVNVISIWDNIKFGKKIAKNIIMSRNIVNRVLKNIIFNTHTAKLFIPKKKYDISLAYSGYSNFIDLVAGNSKANKKFIWVHADFLTQYNIDKDFRKNFKAIYKKYKYFNKIVCVSEKAAINLKTLKSDLDSKIMYQWNINKERILPAEENNIVFNKDIYNMVVIARLAKYKGIERLVETCLLLKQNVDNFKIYILGDGPYKGKIESMIKNYSLEENIILLGNIKNIFPILKQANLYISPSDSEGFSSVTLESLISNVPIVATPTASSTDIFKHIAPKNSMLLTEDFTPNALCTTILRAKSKLSKDFNFDIQDLNRSILESFESNILN